MSAPGTFHGVGVGPGDPELVTLKARRVIAEAHVIAFPASAGGDSLARRIAAEFIPPGAEELAISIPMATERAPARAAYDAAAADIAVLLDQGRDVAFLCEGDPLFYGSYMYLHARIARTHRAVVIPGVTSLTACAAMLGAPLAGRDDVLKVVPATLDEDRLRQELGSGDKLAVIKVGRHFDRLRRVLGELGLTDRATIVCAATRNDQKIMRLADMADGEQPYFSTILIARSGEEW